jgi:hypothetical protein
VLTPESGTWGRALAAARRGIREALATCTGALGEAAEYIAQTATLAEEFKLPVKQSVMSRDDVEW